MKPAEAISLITCGALCVTAGWLGRSLAHLQRDSDSSLVLSTGNPVNHSAPASIPVHAALLPGGFESQKDLEKRLLRQAAARCSTEALWDSVLQGLMHDDADVVADELVDREGVAALRKILEKANDPSPPPGVFISPDLFFKAYAKRDPLAALELYRSQDEDTLFGMVDCRSALVESAISTSASRVVETLEVIEAAPHRLSNLEEEIIYPPGFDFRTLLDYLATHSGRLSLPQDLTIEWAHRDPAAALDWVHDHPEFSYEHSVFESDYSPPADLNRIETDQAILKAPVAARDQAFVRLSHYPQKDRDQVWADIGRASGKVDPALLNTSNSMGSAAAYLAASIDQTTWQDHPDASWAQVPHDQRETAIAARLASWTKSDPTPNGEKARTFWLANFRKACGE